LQKTPTATLPDRRENTVQQARPGQMGTAGNRTLNTTRDGRQGELPKVQNEIIPTAAGQAQTMVTTKPPQVWLVFFIFVFNGLFTWPDFDNTQSA
jgi:hypothetical protein